jgi:hypothetical protein
MIKVKRKPRGDSSFGRIKVSGNLKKLLVLLALSLAITGGLYAQTEVDFPAGDFWSLDGGIGWGGFMEDGKSFSLIIDPKLWLSPPLMVGAKAAVNYAFESLKEDPNATSDTLMFEGQVYLRWNFLRLGQNVNKKINIFAQGGLGLVAAYRGDANPFDEKTETRGSLLLDGALGVTIPLTERWHIEPQVRGGYPHLFGVALTAGYKFRLPEKTEYRTEYIRSERVVYRDVIKTLPPIEIAKVLKISMVEFIIFGPDIGSYNLGVDNDGRSANDLVMNETADFLKNNPDYFVRLEGNANPVTADPREAEELMALSTYRANTVARELEKRGVSRSQMLVMAFGGTRKITSEQDRWNMNRRVELIIMNADTGAE